MVHEDTLAEISRIIQQQRLFFDTGATLNYQTRLHILQQLLQLVRAHESSILEALHKDLHKSRFEAWGVEFGVIEQEILLAIRQLKRWMRPRKLRTPLFHQPAKSYRIAEPYGCTLVIAPWNYPFMLALRPCIAALAAGNTVLLKPAELSTHTARLLQDLINGHFDAGHFCVINTDAEGSAALVQEKFDFIFFTGGSAVGKEIYTAAAAHLTPVILELGGKNPCIVDQDIDLKVTAARIAWGKFSNAGQTCVAPDFLIVHESVKDALVQELQQNLDHFFGKDPASSPDFGRIVSINHTDRILALLQDVNILYGGQINRDERFISPTLVDIPSLNHPIMEAEIFGPVLPILTYKSEEDIRRIVRRNPNPLVLYVFTRNKSFARKMIHQIPSGDASINELVIHFGHLFMPIGGRGSSGFGKYQGKYGFDACSHFKSVLDKKFIADLKVRYPPYTPKKLQLLQWLFKWLFAR
jgi:aldehyde dehydrogenase (NAD+)